MTAAPPNSRCGIDTVDIARMEKLVRDHPPEGLLNFFSETELQDAGQGAGRAASLAARFAAKEACCKLFPRETSLGILEPTDFSVCRDAYGAPQVVANPQAQAVLDRHRIGAIRLSLTHTDTSASAVALAEMRRTEVPWFGKVFYHLCPWRRALVLENFHRVFGDVLPKDEIMRLVYAYYAHYLRFLIEFIRLPFMSAKKRKAFIRVENMESPLRARRAGKGVILLTGHFGNWEVSTIAGITQFPEFKGLLHFVRRPLKPEWLNRLVTRRFRRAGFGTLAKRGSLDELLGLLEGGAAVVYVFDQYAINKDGVMVDFLGHPASTFKSPALLALNTKSPVIPCCSWREPDGTHVLRFEEPLPLIECEDAGEAIRQNTRTYNAAIERMLLRHPEQWIWMHRRWKTHWTRPARKSFHAGHQPADQGRKQ
ncbi:MAG TPA: 4'-phosphopantetheinyl transferase superfamily protein [Verrucomicrobiae bacterium]|nr:4'-phosphopantetheinyl transferase superfamily protein [Verrucomicrobiae bacterium]